jgi:hypothetical protein
MSKNIIRLTESELHDIVMETVQDILKEYGETPEGQRKLGSLCARKTLRNVETNDIHNYAAKSRENNGGKAIYNDYADGYVEYLHNHPEEMAKYTRRKFHEK